MLYLGIDSSAKTASVAVADEKMSLRCECFINAGLTHSETLMPMIDQALGNAKLGIGDIDVICVNAGPGSFTGIRIGVAAAKGLAFTADKACVGVSTLDSIAQLLRNQNGIICCVMDARCSQVYAAIFRAKENNLERLSQDIAISIEELYNRLKDFGEHIVFAGDGAEICYRALASRLANSSLACEQQRYQRGYGVILAAIAAGEAAQKNSALLEPVYLRLPQAERELKLRKDGENK